MSADSKIIAFFSLVLANKMPSIIAEALRLARSNNVDNLEDTLQESLKESGQIAADVGTHRDDADYETIMFHDDHHDSFWKM